MNALAGFAMLVYGLAALEVWPAVTGPALIILGQLWRIDRLGILYEQSGDGE